MGIDCPGFAVARLPSSCGVLPAALPPLAATGMLSSASSESTRYCGACTAIE